LEPIERVPSVRVDGGAGKQVRVAPAHLEHPVGRDDELRPTLVEPPIEVVDPIEAQGHPVVDLALAYPQGHHLRPLLVDVVPELTPADAVKHPQPEEGRTSAESG